jgi:hypothetical protein
MEHSVHSLASSIVRIRNAQGSVVGAGFLAAEGLVCTCAHVVAAALGTPPNAKSRPEGDVQLEFFLDGSTSSGTVEAWHPQGGTTARRHSSAAPKRGAARAGSGGATGL